MRFVCFLSSFVSRLLSLGSEARLAPTKMPIKREVIIFVCSTRQGVARNILGTRFEASSGTNYTQSVYFIFRLSVFIYTRAFSLFLFKAFTQYKLENSIIGSVTKL